MTAFRITIDDRTYEGGYSSKATAVYGAMLKDENDRAAEVSKLRPEWKTVRGKRIQPPKAAYAPMRRAYAELHHRDYQPSSISIEVVHGRRVTKKIHRVEL